ncbi:transposase [Streptomyces decoyicus]|uniref:transposase n=1 Tax=Streptomyces decoyicus TaxID=249567 RepID=UPI0036421D72
MGRICAVRRRCRITVPPPAPSFLPCFPHLVRGLRLTRSPTARHHRRPLVPEVEAFIDPGYSNAKCEGINRVIKLVARDAFGFRNVVPLIVHWVRVSSRLAGRDAAPWYSTSLSERPVRALSGAAVPDACSCSALPHCGRIGEHRLHLSGGRPVA